MKEFTDALIKHGWIFPAEVDGLIGKAGKFEEVVEGLNAAVTRSGKDQKAERLSFPPALPFTGLKKSGYLASFPNLAGTVHCFCGNDRDHRNMLKCIAEGDDSWTSKQENSGVALTPAACYPVYPLMATRGIVPAQGYVVDVFSYCYRHEPSIDPMRMQMFRMREYIRIGTPEQVEQFRNMWMERGQTLVANLKVPFEVDVANDPFFGRGGQIIADAQREQKLKFELLIPVMPDKLSACLSFNYHLDHFGEIYEMHTEDGNLAHTACVGFGMERLTLALVKHHGFNIMDWPKEVGEFLWPE